ncbi:polysaccharide export outer membrane protein [Thiocapsa roseopersicina]|uniref:Polysaccharide export outer membrane protein n=1 Tax=Thiocapsa roseopersicina TaxID=1058 RepID=A0A1H2QDP0_THIRO|nr:polysaccharide export outer membrane protein [Thiocapsa roseopersicina]
MALTAVFLLTLLLGGCGGPVPRGVGSDVTETGTTGGNPLSGDAAKQYPTAPGDVETVPVTIGPPPDPSLDDLVYRIGPYDLLRVDVFGVEEMSSAGRVNFQGYYTMPLVGSISVNGLTTDEAESEIERLLGSRYLRNPSVSVHVEETANMNITLSGKMNGSLQISGRTTLGQVLASSGGVPPVGKKRQVVIFRATDETRQTPNPQLHAYVVDYQAILEGKLRDPLLVGNDRIYVPPSALALFFDPWLGVLRTYSPVDVQKTVTF